MMATIEEALDIAIDHHASGRLAEAETIYSRILDVDPRNAPALHLAGVLACQTDRLDTALDRLGLAVREAPGMAAYRVDHAKALTAARRWSDVAAALRPALLVLAPDSAEGWYFLALLKADVEGMEAMVVEGAVRSIARCRPALYLENDREEQSADLIAMLQGLGYRLWWHIVPIYNPANHAGNRYDAFPGVVSLNLLGLPKGRPCPMQTLPPVIGPGQSWREALTG
ncbi:MULTISPECIES: FkbM family methyltransferase [Azospirillum]|nr:MULTISPECIES: FkbM family methyltransferase [Azospirillum]ALJ38565.1 hypothetical protein AMK58_24155 [Azospirillum brasilense]MDW7553231.1 FkbM family methyltransferase [Azospirillum brasilense]MDW7593390.1 FkbM family methyltransferase [Azospirillum brasilense]MDW7628550.1 FkbM family methyltransferase [Azospirillum brasilense]MDX5955355.1 FkbM family methyltransferase [Azospirillum brasilense]